MTPAKKLGISYTIMVEKMETMRFELTTPALQGRCSPS